MRVVAVTEQDARIKAEGKFLVVERSGRPLKKLRTHDLDQLLLFGSVELSSGALALLARSSIDTVFLTLRGTFRARLWTRDSNNVLLRWRQWERAREEGFASGIARSIVVAKMAHQRQILLRAQRELRNERLAEGLTRMRMLAQQARACSDVASLRGFEGAAAAIYFGHFGKLLRNETFEFHGRNRRPPRDPVNAALSFCYALLQRAVEAEVLRCGLDPLLGFFHEPARGRPSLVLDVMEEFRPWMDQLVLRLINRRQLGQQDFERKIGESLAAVLAEDGEAEEGEDVGVEAVAGDGAGCSAPPGGQQEAVYLGETGRKIVLQQFFARMRDRLYYGRRQQRLELREVIREQCYHLARVIEGREESYTAFSPEK